MAKTWVENEEATEAWNGVLFDRFVQYRDIVTAGLGAHGEAALAAPSAAPGERVLDIGCGFGDTTRRIAALVGPDGSALGIDVGRALHRGCPRGGRGGRRRERALRRRRRPGDGVRGALRLRLLPLRHDVLRQPGPGAAQRPPRARARRPPLHGRLAAQARQRVAPPGRDGRREFVERAGGVRRADLRPRAVLDGRRRHHQRILLERRLRGRLAAPLRPRDPDRPRPRRGGRVRDGARAGGRGDPPRRRRRERIRPQIAAALREALPSSCGRTESGRRPRPGSSRRAAATDRAIQAPACGVSAPAGRRRSPGSSSALPPPEHRGARAAAPACAGAAASQYARGT